MTAIDLKQKIVKELEGMPDDGIEGFYGVLMNYIRNQESEEEWQNLSTNEQNGILEADGQINSGLGIDNKQVFKRVRGIVSND